MKNQISSGTKNELGSFMELIESIAWICLRSSRGIAICIELICIADRPPMKGDPLILVVQIFKSNPADVSFSFRLVFSVTSA